MTAFLWTFVAFVACSFSFGLGMIVGVAAERRAKPTPIAYPFRPMRWRALLDGGVVWEGDALLSLNENGLWAHSPGALASVLFNRAEIADPNVEPLVWFEAPLFGNKLSLCRAETVTTLLAPSDGFPRV